MLTAFFISLTSSFLQTSDLFSRCWERRSSAPGLPLNHSPLQPTNTSPVNRRRKWILSRCGVLQPGAKRVMTLYSRDRRMRKLNNLPGRKILHFYIFLFVLWAGWMWWRWRRLHSAPHSVTFDTKMGQKHVRAAAVAAVAAVTEPRNIRNNNLASNDSALSGRPPQPLRSHQWNVEPRDDLSCLVLPLQNRQGWLIKIPVVMVVGKYFSMEEIMRGQWHSSNSGSWVESNCLVLRWVTASPENQTCLGSVHKRGGG